MTNLGQIGPFSLIEILGQGGMAIVYLAEHPTFGRLALRVVRKGPTKAHQEIIEAERTGAQQHILLSEAGCPNLPKAYPPFEDEEGRYFCVPVEYVAGETLAHRIERSPLSEQEAIRIALEVCRNLECAHKLRVSLNGTQVDHVVHGDLKPANIMVGPNGEVRVLDYGISKPILEQKSATRQVFGAAVYSSPERLSEKKFDLHTDLWAVGVMLYEMVAGRRPFEGNEVEVRQAFVEGRRPAPLRNASSGYRAVVQKALSYDRSRRYPTVDELIADLERIHNGAQPYALYEIQQSENDRTVRVSDDALPPVDPATATVREPLRDNPADKRAAPRKSPAAAARRARLGWRIALGMIAVLLVTAVYTGWHEFQIMQEARQLQREIERKTDVALADWKTYEYLKSRSWSPFPLRDVTRIIKQRYKEYAARAFADYRDGLSRALSGQRRQTAEIYLQRVVELDPGDTQARAMLLIVQGYGLPLNSQENGRKAIHLFEQAARLDSRNPDPFLAVARASVYALHDTERAAAAMDEARERGYVDLDRDKALMADGYRYEAIDLWRSARKMDCDDVDKKLLNRIKDLFERSIDLYRRIPQFSGTATNLENARVTLDEVKEFCPDSSWWKIWERM